MGLPLVRAFWRQLYLIGVQSVGGSSCWWQLRADSLLVHGGVDPVAAPMDPAPVLARSNALLQGLQRLIRAGKHRHSLSC